jgi:Arylsulfotransferase (ASST)
MNKIQKIALLYIVVVIVLVYGYSVGRFKVYPYDFIEKYVQDYQKFAAGDVLEKKSSTFGKLQNDFGFSFRRWDYDYPKHAVDSAVAVEDPSLSKRKDLPRLYVHENHRDGYRAIFGAFNMQKSFWGGMLINSEGKVVHVWNPSTKHLPAEFKEDQRKNLYGLHVFPDGSIIYSMQEHSGGLVKIDACSNVVWNLEGKFHHTVSPDAMGYFWSFRGESKTFEQDMVKISVETGKIVDEIHMADVRRANPDLHLWKLSLRWDTDTSHMTHGNDIEPLTPGMAAKFPGFKVGDLLISYAATNLIFILDPETLKVKWWRVGISDFQHDPDWEPDGQIAIFSNNQRSERKFSDIVTIDPETMEHHIVVDGSKLDFYSPANGRHELTEFGTRYVTSSQQGWAFEVDRSGKVVSSFVNVIDSAEGRALHLSEALRFKEDYFEPEFWKKCSN